MTEYPKWVKERAAKLLDGQATVTLDRSSLEKILELARQQGMTNVVEAVAFRVHMDKAAKENSNQ